ncbi:Methyltransferase-like protein 27 [Bulinus truncatus]|nr:Methyltransferase-like protein 27 [Bulinus truncatus]
MDTKVISSEFEHFLLSFQRPGIGSEACVDGSKSVGYCGPRYCADMLAALVKDKENAVLLDMAAGTGFVGEELKDRGFRHIHAHDGAVAMLEICKQKGLYSKYIHCFIQEGKTLPIYNGEYYISGSIFRPMDVSIYNHSYPRCHFFIHSMLTE